MSDTGMPFFILGAWPALYHAPKDKNPERLRRMATLTYIHVHRTTSVHGSADENYGAGRSSGFRIVLLAAPFPFHSEQWLEPLGS